jgi:Protein of unknown function (DUF1559)
MRRPAFAICVLLLCMPLAQGEEKKTTGIDVKALKPFLEERTVAVLHVDLTRLDLDALQKQIAPLFALVPVAPEKLPKEWTDLVVGLKKLGVTGLDVIFSMADLPEQSPILVFHGAEPAGASEVLTASKLFPLHVFQVREKIVVGAEKKTLARLDKMEPTPRPDLERAFAATEPGLAVLALVAGDSTRKIVQEVLPMLPEPLGGSSKMLTQGLEWVVLRVDAAGPLALHFVAKTADNDAALEIQKLADRGLKFIVKQQPTPAVEKLTRLLALEVDGDRLQVKVEGPTLIGLLAQPVDKARQAAQRNQSVNNLKQLGLAMYAYHDVNRSFPPYASQDKTGKALLSWRVQMLPFIEEGPLYKEFRLDEPWDSEHNKKLIPRMPRLFATPGNPKQAADGKTTYLAPLGEKTMFSGFKTMKFSDVTDGTSNTIFLVQAADDQAVIWTKPDDLKYDAKEPLKGLGFRYGDTFVVLFVDGSVRMLPKAIDKDTLRALFTPAGGEAIKQLP